MWLFNFSKMKKNNRLLSHTGHISSMALGGDDSQYDVSEGRGVCQEIQRRGIFGTVFREVMLEIVPDLSLDSSVMRKTGK